MNAEQKLRFSKYMIVVIALCLTIVLIVFMVLEHNLKTLFASMDLQKQKVEVSCTFEDTEKED